MVEKNMRTRTNIEGVARGLGDEKHNERWKKETEELTAS